MKAFALIILLTGCSAFKGIDKQIGEVMRETEDEYCSHSEPHRDLFMDEVNEKLTASNLIWTCKDGH